MLPLGAEGFREIRLRIMRWGNILVYLARLNRTTKFLIRGRQKGDSHKKAL